MQSIVLSEPLDCLFDIKPVLTKAIYSLRKELNLDIVTLNFLNFFEYDFNYSRIVNDAFFDFLSNLEPSLKNEMQEYLKKELIAFSLNEIEKSSLNQLIHAGAREAFLSILKQHAVVLYSILPQPILKSLLIKSNLTAFPFFTSLFSQHSPTKMVSILRLCEVEMGRFVKQKASIVWVGAKLPEDFLHFENISFIECYWAHPQRLNQLNTHNLNRARTAFELPEIVSFQIRKRTVVPIFESDQIGYDAEI